MFEIQWSRDKLICKMTERPEAHKLIEPAEMSCEVILNLGLVPGEPAGKALLRGMEKTFNALATRKSGNFIKDMNNQVRALGKVIEKNGVDASGASGFLTTEETNLKKLWKNWSEKLAPRLAEEALQEVVRTAREIELKDMNTKKAKAVGRVIAVPALTLAAAAASILSTNVAGAGAAVLKAAGALMKASEDLSAALNEFSSDQAAAEKDISALAGALKTIFGRINSMDKQRKFAEMELASLKSQQRVLAKELSGQKDMPAEARKKTAKTLVDNEAALKAIISGLPDTAALKESWKTVAAEHKKMSDAIGSVGAAAPKSLRNVRDLTDGAKEILTILSKLN